MADLISILVPMRNAQDYVRAAIESILAQHDVELEVIVIDDGSTDKSAQIVRSMNDPRIKLIKGPEAGISEAVNFGLDHATGKYVARCDADDRFAPDRLLDQMQFLKWHDDFAAVAGAFVTVDYQDRPVAALNCGDADVDITSELLAGTTRTHLCTWLIRRTALDAAGQFRSWFVTAEDIDVQLRLAMQGQIQFQPAVRYYYRIHDASITHQQPDETRIFYERAAKEFAKQRKDTGTDDLARGTPPEPPKNAQVKKGASEHVWRMLERQSWIEHKAGRKTSALKFGWRLFALRPLRPRSWKNVILLLLRPAGKRKM